MFGMLCAVTFIKHPGRRKQLIRRILFTISLTIIGLTSSAWAVQVKGQISNQNETVHVEFSGQETWEYDLKKVRVGNRSFMQLSLANLDEDTIQKLSSFKSPFVKSLKFEKQKGDNKNLVLFELADDSVESFDYLTDQPSRLVVDFFIGSGKKLPVAAAAKKPATKKIAKLPPKKVRTPAGSDVLVLQKGEANTDLAKAQDSVRAGLFDGGDPQFDRFSIKDYEINEHAIQKSKENYYIPFPMLELENGNWDKVKAAVPEFAIHPEDTNENKEARLLLTLYKKKRYNVYLKTLQWFKEKYPDSKYNEVIAFMTGEVYYRQWQDEGKIDNFDMAIETFKSAVRKFPTSILAERTSLLIGYYQLDRGDNLAAIKYLNDHANNSSFGDAHVFSKDLARLGVYLGYLRLNKYNEAFETVDALEKETPHTDLKVEAAYRKGDIFMKSKNYSRAVEEYQRALSTYPQGSNSLSNAYFNQAESLFSLDKFKESLGTFKEYVKKFPTNNHAPFALTRMGEILEIMGADKSKVMGAYLETYFRYGENPSAIIARLRLLSAKMKGMKKKEVDTTVAEILSLADKLNIPHIQQFATVMIADGFNQRKEYDKALDLLVKYYQQDPSSVDEPQLKKRIVANINDKLREEIQDGQFIKGLKTHQKYADNWLKGTEDRLDTTYFLGRAFEMGGANQTAEKYYQQVLNSYYASVNTDKAKSLAVLDYLPSLDSLNLRLANVTYALGRFNRAFEQIKNIKRPEKMTDEEQIERVSLAVKLLDKKGDVDSAIRYLTELLKVWQGVPSLLAEPYLNLAELETKAGREQDAQKSLEKIDKMMKDSGKIPTNVHATALEKLGDLYFKDKQIEKCVAAYKGLLEQYEDKKPLSSIRYKLGKIYFDRGEIQKAADIWGHFKNDKGGTWQKLAQEELKGVEWQADYKKYLKRIPAMAGKEK